jgi:hypothetical protein
LGRATPPRLRQSGSKGYGTPLAGGGEEPRRGFEDGEQPC